MGSLDQTLQNYLLDKIPGVVDHELTLEVVGMQKKAHDETFMISPFAEVGEKEFASHIFKYLLECGHQKVVLEFHPSDNKSTLDGLSLMGSGSEIGSIEVIVVFDEDSIAVTTKYL